MGLRRLIGGFSVLELLFVVVVMAILSGVTVPLMLSGLDRARATSGARYLAQQCGIARFRAVARGRYVALRFTTDGDDYAAQMFEDGNRNGVRIGDVEARTDVPIGHPMLLSAQFSGVRVALDPELGLGSAPVRLSGSTLLSFSPAGTATAGTIYVLGRDGTQLAIRVLGVTGRTRVLRFDRATRVWEQP